MNEPHAPVSIAAAHQTRREPAPARTPSVKALLTGGEVGCYDDVLSDR